MPPTNRKSPTVAAYLKEYKRKRDFEKTQEPSGGSAPAQKRDGELAFVIQKHAASHLHFDLRLEVDGVMKSWAVPKGPSVDTSVKRLAMEVEDHPIAYNTFEGTIPKGEYGGGTVMLWDRGTYTADEIQAGENDQDAARRGLKAGKLAFSFHGKRLQGSFALVRTRRGEERAQWLLFKHTDEYAKTGRDIVAEVTTSVASNRTMEEIAAGDNGALGSLEETGGIEPMEATRAKLPLPGGEYAVEAFVEGIRAVAFIANGTAKLMAMSKTERREHSELLTQAPEVEAALVRLARQHGGALVLDGVLTADRQSYVAVDLLLDGEQPLVDEPMDRALSPIGVGLELARVAQRGEQSARPLELGSWIAADSSELPAAALQLGTRHVIAKRIDSPYEAGRSKYWFELNP